MSKYVCEECCDQKQYYHGKRVYCADCEDIGITAQNKEIAELDKFVSELMALVKEGRLYCKDSFCTKELTEFMKSDAWKKREK